MSESNPRGGVPAVAFGAETDSESQPITFGDESDDALRSIAFGDEPASESKPVVSRPVSEEDKFKLAKAILLALAILFILGGVSYLSSETSGKEIFDACTTILPPIATLVLGYYFAKT